MIVNISSNQAAVLSHLRRRCSPMFKALSSAFALISILFPSTTYDLKEMRDYFKKNIAGGPYIYLQSPRSGLGVGTIYTVPNGQMIFYSRPEECFSKTFLAQATSAESNDKMVADSLDLSGTYS